MATDTLAAMNLQELRHERHLAKIQLANNVAMLSGLRGRDRIEQEEVIHESKEYINIINARIARLERAGRN